MGRSEWRLYYLDLVALNWATMLPHTTLPLPKNRLCTLWWRSQHTKQGFEQYLLDLEREAFLSLCGEIKTQQRMESILKLETPSKLISSLNNTKTYENCIYSSWKTHRHRKLSEEDLIYISGRFGSARDQPTFTRPTKFRSK